MLRLAFFSKKNFFFFLIVLFLCIFLQPVGAAEREQVKNKTARQNESLIRTVRVEGNKRIEKSTILSYADVPKNAAYSLSLANSLIKKIYATGMFEKVTVQFKKNELVIQVQERSVITQILFEGNKEFGAKDLEKEISLTRGATFTSSKLQTDIERIKMLYARSGYYAAHITARAENLPDNRVKIIYEIRENFVSYVEKIDFGGDIVFDKATLKGVVSTKEWTWWRFFSGDDKYDVNRIDYDKDLLRQFYINHGYIDFSVVDITTNISPDFRRFTLMYNIQAGDHYRFGRLSVQTRLSKLNRDKLASLIFGKSGDSYNTYAVQATLDALAYEAWVEGFPFVKVTSDFKKNEKDKTIDITFSLEPGERLSIQRVNILGNTRTLDTVVRRVLNFSDGDAFNQALFKRSYYNLRALDYFEDINLTTSPGDDPHQVDVNVALKEKSTGTITFSLGYSSLNGILSSISLTDNNMLGLGRSLSTNFILAQESRVIGLNFTNPYFLGRNLALSVGVDYQWLDLRKESSYTVKTIGTTTQLGFPLSEHGALAASYRLSRQDILDIGKDASSAVKDAAGISVRSILGLSYTYDRKDDPLDPTSGWDFSLSEYVAGFGGTIRYSDTRIQARFFYTLIKDFVASLKVQTAYLNGLGKRTNINDRYLVGGDLFPGFDRSGAGPRDLDTKDSLGAQTYFLTTLATTVPNGLPTSLGIGTNIFTQFGWSGLADGAPAHAATNLAFRQTVGLSFQFKYVLGVNLVFAVPIIKQDYDHTLLFLLTARAQL